MKLTVLAAVAIVGATLGFLAPAPANAMPITQSPVDISEPTAVQKIHERHREWRSGHRHHRTTRRGAGRHFLIPLGHHL